VKDIPGVDADVGFESDYLIHGLDKSVDDIFLAHSQAALAPPVMVLPGAQVTIGEMTNPHKLKYKNKSLRFKSQR